MPSTVRDATLLVGGAGLAYALVVGLAAGGIVLPRAMLPILLALPATVVLWTRLAGGDASGARRLMAAWAAGLVVLGTIAMSIAPEAAAEVVAFGPEYRDEMLHWVMTGEGAEGDLGAFLPIHLRRLALFAPLALITGGALALAMGAVMVNYMNLFVASYAAAAGGAAGLLAWFPWALCRIAAFTILGVLLAEPLIRWFRARRDNARRQGGDTAPVLDDASFLHTLSHIVTPRRGRVLAWVAVLLALDVLLKALLAPAWGEHLASLLP